MNWVIGFREGQDRVGRHELRRTPLVQIQQQLRIVDSRDARIPSAWNCAVRVSMLISLLISLKILLHALSTTTFAVEVQ